MKSIMISVVSIFLSFEIIQGGGLFLMESGYSTVTNVDGRDGE